MITFKEHFLYEEITKSDDYLVVYHGGGKFDKYSAEIRAPKQGRFESGVGINTTTKYETARSHAKGGKIVSLIYVDKSLTFAHDVMINIPELEDFVKSNRIIGKAYFIKRIYEALGRSRFENELPANYIVNIEINSKIGNQSGLIITNYLASKGVDASYYNQSAEEDWLIIHNPKIIRNVVHTKPSDITLGDYVLPKIKEQLGIANL